MEPVQIGLIDLDLLRKQEWDENWIDRERKKEQNKKQIKLNDNSIL